MDIVTYLASGEFRGKFLHKPAGGEPRIVGGPGGELGLIGDQPRTVILRLHGGIDRVDPERDSFVISEDDYINYSRFSQRSRPFLPMELEYLLAKQGSFLFLG